MCSNTQWQRVRFPEGASDIHSTSDFSPVAHEWVNWREDSSFRKKMMNDGLPKGQYPPQIPTHTRRPPPLTERIQQCASYILPEAATVRYGTYPFSLFSLSTLPFSFCPSLPLRVCVSECVCVPASLYLSLSFWLSVRLSLCVRACVRAYGCVCVCVCAHACARVCFP
jgi:hypothetical protein